MTLLVHAEQGLGDEISSRPCLPEIIAQAGALHNRLPSQARLHFRVFVSRGLGARRPPVGRSVVARGLTRRSTIRSRSAPWRCTRAAAPAISPAIVDTFAPTRGRLPYGRSGSLTGVRGSYGRNILAGRYAGIARAVAFDDARAVAPPYCGSRASSFVDSAIHRHCRGARATGKEIAAYGSRTGRTHWLDYDKDRGARLLRSISRSRCARRSCISRARWGRPA